MKLIGSLLCKVASGGLRRVLLGNDHLLILFGFTPEGTFAIWGMNFSWQITKSQREDGQRQTIYLHITSLLKNGLCYASQHISFSLANHIASPKSMK